MDSSLGFKVISSSRADANMEEGELSDGASTGFEIQGSTPELPRTSSNISIDTASFHTADGLESDYPREYILRSVDGGDDLSSRLLQQGAQYFSATEGDSDSDIDERSTLRADHYVEDPDQPKLALAEDSIHPSPTASGKRPPPQGDEYRGSQSRRGNQVVTERSPLLNNSSSERKDEESARNCCTIL